MATIYIPSPVLLKVCRKALADYSPHDAGLLRSIAGFAGTQAANQDKAEDVAADGAEAILRATADAGGIHAPCDNGMTIGLVRCMARLAYRR